MVFPASVFLVKGLGWAQSLAFIAISNREMKGLRSADITQASVGSSLLLLVYRCVMLLWAISIGVNQALDKGRYVFAFFTVWNWWLLALFFALAAASSLRAWRRGTLSSPGEEERRPADWVERAALAAYSVEAPMVAVIDGMTWLVLVPMLKAAEQSQDRKAFWRGVHHNWESYNMVSVIDIMTWMVLVPMLMATPDPDKRQFWVERLYCFESYNQHGFNAVMMAGELVLNRMPMNFWASGWMALWVSVFGVWSTIFFIHTGRFIYPFLDAHKPFAWLAYLGLYGVHWSAFLVVMGLVRAKGRLLARLKVASSKSKSS